mmetsp:Transcript_96884/g.202430  ORF Transcript_96884/g.202430 Transcript_96884/m.202430 type:complete len:257 (+) Transcript_96884:647-1417(+)
MGPPGFASSGRRQPKPCPSPGIWWCGCGSGSPLKVGCQSRACRDTVSEQVPSWGGGGSCSHFCHFLSKIISGCPTSQCSPWWDGILWPTSTNKLSNCCGSRDRWHASLHCCSCCSCRRRFSSYLRHCCGERSFRHSSQWRWLLLLYGSRWALPWSWSRWRCRFRSCQQPCALDWARCWFPWRSGCLCLFIEPLQSGAALASMRRGRLEEQRALLDTSASTIPLRKRGVRRGNHTSSASLGGSIGGTSTTSCCPPCS